MPPLNHIPYYVTAVATLLYLVATQVIDSLNPVRIDVDDLTTNHLLEKIENYEFQGLWTSSGAIAGHPALPGFKQTSGSVKMKLYLARRNMGLNAHKNVTYESDRAIQFHFRMSDGRPGSARHDHLFKIPYGENLEAPYLISKRMTFFVGHQPVECTFMHNLTINKTEFQYTRELQDVTLCVSWWSEDPGCQSSVEMTLRFDDELSNKRLLKFLIAAILLSIIEAAFTLESHISLLGFNSNYRFQSVTFWSFMASMSSLHCFVLLYTSTDYVARLGLFMVVATLNFVNCALVTLLIINKHARFVGEVARLEIGGEAGELAKLRTKTAFFCKASFVVILGMAFGIAGFPSEVLLIALPLSFTLQIALAARLNERFFKHSISGFVLCVTKLLFCVSSKGPLCLVRLG